MVIKPAPTLCILVTNTPSIKRLRASSLSTSVDVLLTDTTYVTKWPVIMPYSAPKYDMQRPEQMEQATPMVT